MFAQHHRPRQHHQAGRSLAADPTKGKQPAWETAREGNSAALSFVFISLTTQKSKKLRRGSPAAHPVPSMQQMQNQQQHFTKSPADLKPACRHLPQDLELQEARGKK